MSNWCGIDCSGFVQRCAQAAGSRYLISRNMPLDSGDGQSGNQVPASGFGSYCNSVSDVNLETGDVAYWSTHIVMLAKVNTVTPSNSKIFEASADGSGAGGRCVKESFLYKYTSYTLGRLIQ